MSNLKVFLGVGHGGNDPGAVSGVHIEKNYNLDIALYCKEELIRHGIDVAMSRTKDEDDTLSEEIKECNAFNPSLAVDVHNNAGGGDGFEVYYYHKGGTSLTLAKNIEAEVVSIGQNSRGCKTKLNTYGSDWFGWIRETNAPAVLAEFAFVDSADVEIIDTPEERKKMGEALAKGILKTLGIAYQPKVEVLNESATLYRVQVGAFEHKQNADKYSEKVKADGYNNFIVYISGLYKVQVGAFANENNAENLLEQLKHKGYKPFITTISGEVKVFTPVPQPAPQSVAPAINYFPATPYTGISIVSGLSAIGVINSYNYRAQIAQKNGISNYSGTPDQNTQMLNLLQQGKLIRP